jgi:hypothetical protein
MKDETLHPFFIFSFFFPLSIFILHLSPGSMGIAVKVPRYGGVKRDKIRDKNG